MIDKSKEIYFWNLVSVNYLTATVDALHRIQNNQTANSNDYQIRDMYFSNNYSLNDKKSNHNFITKAVFFIKNLKVFDKLAFFQSLSFQNTLMKYNFWKKIYKMHPKNQKQAQCQKKVSTILWNYRILPLLVFGTGMIYLFKVTGVNKLKHRKYLLSLIGSCWLVDTIIKYRKSDNIFYQIGKLPIAQLQQQRMSIINQSLVLDGKINEGLKLQPLSLQLLKVAREENDIFEKKNILKTAGFQIVSNSNQSNII